MPTAIMLGGMFMQPLVGFILDRFWDGTTAGGARLYPLVAYQWGFGMMLIWGALSLVLLCFTRETYCRALR